MSKDSPPLLLVHGEQDDLVPFSQSVEMTRAYQDTGLTVEFIPVKNAGHDFEQIGPEAITPSVDEIHRKTVAFFKRYLDDERSSQ